MRMVRGVPDTGMFRSAADLYHTEGGGERVGVGVDVGMGVFWEEGGLDGKK